MPILVDTNILARRSQPDHPMHAGARVALELLRARQDRLCVATQNLIEFWAVATRPLAANGLGLSPEQAVLELNDFERAFEHLRDTPDVYDIWRRLVQEVGVHGRQVHDAHLAATMLAHGLDQILTFNIPDFQRYPGITALHPQDVVDTTQPPAAADQQGPTTPGK